MPQEVHTFTADWLLLSTLYPNLPRAQSNLGSHLQLNGRHLAGTSAMISFVTYVLSHGTRSELYQWQNCNSNFFLAIFS